MKNDSERVAKVLWKSKSKHNGLGNKYRLILDKAGWVRAQIKVDCKGKWQALDNGLHYTDTRHASIIGGFEEALGREVFKVKSL